MLIAGKRREWRSLRALRTGRAGMGWKRRTLGFELLELILFWRQKEIG
jgi:hypothetical protein